MQVTIQIYKDKGELVVFDNTLKSRRLYDKMQQHIKYGMYTCEEEKEMYRKLGFRGLML